MRLYEKEFDPFFTKISDHCLGTDYTNKAFIKLYENKKSNGPLKTFTTLFEEVLKETGGDRALYLRSINTDNYNTIP